MKINLDDTKTLKQFSNILLYDKHTDSFVYSNDIYRYVICNHNLCVYLDTNNFPIKRWKSFYTIGGMSNKKSFNIWWIIKVLQI